MTDFSAQRDQAALHGSRLTALVIEPDSILRQFLRRLLERHGIESRLAATLEEGAWMSREDQEIDVILYAARAEEEAPPPFGGSRAPLPVVRYGGVMSPRATGPRRAGSPGRTDTGEVPLDAELLVQSILAAVRRELPHRAASTPTRPSASAANSSETQPVRRSS